MSDLIAPPVFSVRMVRELKGAPLACLVLLLMADQPVSNGWLSNMSGYSDKPIKQALDLLSSPEYQVVCKTYGGWRISDSFNVPLINRRNSVPTTTAFNIDDSQNQQNAVVVGRKNSDFDERFVENLEACKSVGIGEPSASTISGLAHVTPEYIKAHRAGLQKGETIGLAILRIKNGEEPTAKTAEEDVRNKYVEGEYADFVEC